MNFTKSVAASFLILGAMIAVPAAVSAEGLGIAPPGAEAPSETVEAPSDKIAVAAPDAPAETIDAPAAKVAGGPPALPAEVTPPPLPVMPAYYVGIDGQPVGPLDEAALREKVAEGELTESSLVWTEGMQDWAAAAEITEIAALLEPGAEDAAPLGAKAGAEKAEAKKAAPVTEPVVDNASFITGSWQIDGFMPIEDIGMSDAELVQTYNPDGTYLATGTITAALPGYGPAPVEMVVEIVGTWSVTELAGGQSEITVTGTTYVAVPALGIPQQATTSTESFVVELIDANTIVDDEGVEWVRI